MNRFLAVLLAAVALNACSVTARGQPPPPDPTRDWWMEAQEDTAALTYGRADERKLSIECHGGQDPELDLMAWAPGADPKPSEFLLISGGVRQIYPTLTEVNAGRWEMMGHARKNDLVIVAFRETGWLTLMTAGRSETLIPQHDNSAVADFFEWCK